MTAKIKVPNHLHRYKRVNIARNPSSEYLVLKCMKPLCSHYVSLTLALGNLCECNRCGEPFVLDKVSVKQALPHCVDCTKHRKPENVENAQIIAEFLKEHGT
jgi:hypothetical protein